MSGLEVAAAVFGIVGGIASAYKLIADLRKQYEKKKKKGKSSAARTASATIEQRLKRVEDHLRSSEPVLVQLGLRPHGKAIWLTVYLIAADGSEIPDDAFRACNATFEQILLGLRHIANVSLDDALREPERLRLPELERLSSDWHNEASRTLSTIREAITRDHRAMLVASNTSASLTRPSSVLCRNAVLYRLDQCRFDGAAAAQPSNGGVQEWACRLCGHTVSRASLSLPPTSMDVDLVYITPNGFFKAHGARDGLEVWSCIWEQRSDECLQVFNTKRDLLQHMKDVHIEIESGNRRVVVDMPADNREKSVLKCGFSASCRGREMRLEGGKFVVDVQGTLDAVSE